MTLKKIADKFQALIAQQQNVSAGEIADDFPTYFPNKHQTTSPLMEKLDVFLNKVLSSDMNASIKFLVQPGFKPNFQVTVTKGGKPLDDAKISGSILQFLSREMARFPAEAASKYKGKSVDEVLTIANHTF